MLEIWIGRARTGKSGRILERDPGAGRRVGADSAGAGACLPPGGGGPVHAPAATAPAGTRRCSASASWVTRVLAITGGAAEVTLDAGR